MKMSDYEFHLLKHMYPEELINKNLKTIARLTQFQARKFLLEEIANNLWMQQHGIDTELESQ